MTNTIRSIADPRLLAVVLTCVGVCQPAAAVELTLPAGARQTHLDTARLDTTQIPTGHWADGAVPGIEAKGQVSRRAWRIDTEGLTALQVLDPLLVSLAEQDYEPLFQCDAALCGGFDFRFGTEVIPAPAMHIDLSRFRFVSLRKPGDPPDYLTLLVSAGAKASYIQVVQVSASGTAALSVSKTVTALPSPTADTPVGQALETFGHTILGDLAFQTGSSALAEGKYASLATLAAYLKERPGRVVALVGHTDSVGSLDGNIALSKRRAGSVADRLVTKHGVPREQIAAEGMGYLAPVASNLTEEGRTANRRVEAVLLSTE